MRIDLVQHGLAVPKEVDPDRPLSEQGREDVRRLADFLGDAGVRRSEGCAGRLAFCGALGFSRRALESSAAGCSSSRSRNGRRKAKVTTGSCSYWAGSGSDRDAQRPAGRLRNDARPP
jgi:hypothetical protein